MLPIPTTDGADEPLLTYDEIQHAVANMVVPERFEATQCFQCQCTSGSREKMARA